jgi:hypothetical protein
VIANTPAIHGARIFGAIVPVVTVLGGFTSKSATARLADTEGGELAQRASGTILDWPAALAHALGAQIHAAIVPVVTVLGALALRHCAAGTTVAADPTRTAVTTGAAFARCARRFAPHQGQREHAQESNQIAH